MHLNTKDWKFFEFDKIFDIKKGFYNKKPESSGLGKIPFIGATDKNHGITGYYTLDEIKNSSKTGSLKNEPIEKKVFDKNAICITNNGSVGYAYFMDKEFTCSHDVNPVYKKDGDFNYYTGMFISAIIMNDRYRWGYGRKWRPIRMKNSRIKLPVKYDNNKNIIYDSKKYSDEGYIPDWDFMESYIKTLNYDIPQTKNQRTNVNLDVDSWKEFYLQDIFITTMGNGIDSGKTSFNDPTISYVTRNRNNNGVVSVVDKIDGIDPFPSGDMTLALGGSYLGSCFVQNTPFYTAQNVGVLHPKKEISLYSKIFISTLIRNECKVKFQAFGRELNSHFKKDFTIKLPVVKAREEHPIIEKNGYEPDWNFMDEYISILPNGDLI